MNELLTDPNLPAGGPGRSESGAGALTEFEVEAAPAGEPSKITKIKFVKACSINPKSISTDGMSSGTEISTG